MGKNNLVSKLVGKEIQRESKEGNIKVSVETPLRDFTEKLWEEYEKRGKNYARRLAICMLGYLNADSRAHSPRKINTIGDIYSFTGNEIRYGFRCYGKKTWLALNEILTENGLPAVVLPEEYNC